MRILTANEQKRIVKAFYESFGWERHESGAYIDTVSWIDRRPVVEEYQKNRRMTINQYVKPSGLYFLDAGSGPIGHEEYLSYSRGYLKRACLDIATKSLSEARQKLGDGGFYVQADLTHLPFRNDVFDAIVSAHVIYHIPADQQRSAIAELHRTLKPGSTLIIIYSNKDAMLDRLPELLDRLYYSTRDKAFRLIGKIPLARRTWRKVRGQARPNDPEPLRDEARDQIPPLYYHSHGYEWLRRNIPTSQDGRIISAQLVGRNFTTRFVRDDVFGRLLLRMISVFEDTWPDLAGRLACYPMIVATK